MNRFSSHHHTYASHHWWSLCEHTRCGLPRLVAAFVRGAR